MSEKFTLFWGGPCSQWTAANMEIDGVIYNTAEQYMMAEKARLFEDADSAVAIMGSFKPYDQKAIGRKIKNFDKAKWERIEENGKPFCWNVVYKGNYAKFTQNPGLREYLFSTIGTLIVEASPTDKIWGIGLGEDDPKALDRSQWQGTNWLGEVVTQVRDDLLKEIEEPMSEEEIDTIVQKVTAKDKA